MTSFSIDPTKAKATNVANPYDFQGVSAKPPPSSYQRVGSRAAPVPGTAQRLGTAMKSNASAGFKSKPVPEGIAATHGNQPNIEEKKDKSEKDETPIDLGWKILTSIVKILIPPLRMKIIPLLE